MIFMFQGKHDRAPLNIRNRQAQRRGQAIGHRVSLLASARKGCQGREAGLSFATGLPDSGLPEGTGIASSSTTKPTCMLMPGSHERAGGVVRAVVRLFAVGIGWWPVGATAAVFPVDGLSSRSISLLAWQSSWFWAGVSVAGLLVIALIIYVARVRQSVAARRLEDERALTRRLRASQQRLRLAMEVAGVETWDWNLKTDEVVSSPGLATMFGGPEVARLKQEPEYHEFIHPEDRPRVEEAIRSAVEGRGSFHHEFRVVWTDGSEHWIEGRGEVQYDEKGRAASLFGISMDITARKEQEAARRRLVEQERDTRRLESLAVLAGGMAHDFNNLLTSILGNVDMVMRDLPAGSDEAEMLTDAVKAARKAADLCDQMLAYSGGGRFVVAPFNLNRFLRGAAHLLDGVLGEGCELKFDLGPELPDVQADEGQMRQLLVNLVLNAAEAMAGQPGRIVIRTALLSGAELASFKDQFGQSLAPCPHVALMVTDTGEGIPAERLPMVFEPFYTTRFTGRGLGLAAVLGIVRGHHGGLAIRSEPGQGTTVTVVLPTAEAQAAQPMDSAPAIQTGSRAAGKVLIMDDEAPVRQTAGRMLRQMGLEVLSARDGAEGLAQFQANESELILVLLDLKMPGMDGVEVHRMIRKLNGNVPVVLMSGFTEEEARAEFRSGGLAGFLKKPFDWETLAAMVERVTARGPSASARADRD